MKEQIGSRRPKVGMLTHEYGLFSMQPEESIFEMYNHFTTIITNLKGLGNTYTNKELVKKILNSLPKSWEAKMIVIKESKDPNTFPLDELVRSFLTHEMKLKTRKRVQQESSRSKKVEVALKFTIQEKERYDQHGSDEDVAMFVRKFNKFIRLKKYATARKPQRREMIKEVSHPDLEVEHVTIATCH